MSEAALVKLVEAARGTPSREAAFTLGVLDRAQRLAPDNATLNLALAGETLSRRVAHSAELFARVARQHDMREAWLGLAATHHLRAEASQVAEALNRALRGHVLDREFVSVIQFLVRAMGAPGWCSLDGMGNLMVQLTRAPPPGVRPIAVLDERSVPLRLLPSGLAFVGRLPKGWERAAAAVVSLDKAPLLGSPVAIDAIVRVEGFVDSTDGDLHGWAWCPHDPDRDPILSIGRLDGADCISVVADNRGVEIRHDRPLARPRGFRIPASRLQGFDGMLHVCGAGRDLTGSPIDPSAERRNATDAARTFAAMFPAPGYHEAAASRKLSFLSVPAHVIGGPVEGGSKRRPVDVVVPVYGGLDRTLACLESALVDLPRWARVIVVNDASPDIRVGQELGKLAARQRITLLSQTENRGFPGTANAGMRHDPTRDVVLLNSDTLVPPGWLAALREAAYSSADIGSATPLSNDATILSYPSVESPNAMPDLTETIRINALSKSSNAGCLVDIPTAVGFCVYIKRDCLNTTGLLREDLFAQGYGEENDFCIRARHLGWRHVAVTSAFVAHVGGHSFGSSRIHLIERNMRTLNQLHPGYDALIEEFKSADPLADARRRLDMERWKTFRTGERAVLLVTHARGGGVRRHVADRAAALRAEGLRPIVLSPMAGRQGGGSDCVLGNGAEGGTPNLRFTIPAELGLLTMWLKGDRPVRAEVHHMIGHDHRLMDLFQRLDIPYEVVVHDYSWLCPRINLIGPDRHYCGEPDLAGCEACVADAGTLNEEKTPPRALRKRSADEMTGASQVVVSSDDVATRLRRHFPSIQPKIEPWEDDGLLPPADPSPPAADGIRRVCVLGAIGIEKGYDMLLACARDVAKRKLKLRFHLVGHSCDDARLLTTGSVLITGQYDEHEVAAMIDQQQAQLAWLPSLWPETWCYALTRAWQARLNVLAFDIGTQAERIRRTGRGWLVPLGMRPERLNEWLLGVPTNGVAGTGVVEFDRR